MCPAQAARCISPIVMYAWSIIRSFIKSVIQKILTFIKTDCKMDIQDNSIDIIVCFDVFHAFGAKEVCILKEFCRVLNKNGFLLINDHHYQEDELLSKVLNHEMFDLMRNWLIELVLWMEIQIDLGHMFLVYILGMMWFLLFHFELICFVYRVLGVLFL